MLPHSPALFGALATSHDYYSTLSYRNPLTGATAEFQITDGAVTEDVTTFVRRTLSFSAPNLESLLETLSVPGVLITPVVSVKYGTTVETFAKGVFRGDEAQIGYGPSGVLQMTCPDLSIVVQGNRLGVDRSAGASNTVSQEIKRLVECAFTSAYATFPGWAPGSPWMGATTQVGPGIYDAGDRDAVIAQYCTDNSLEFYFDESGLAVLQPVPTTPLGAWPAAMGPSGVMTDATRTRSVLDTKNVIILTTTATDIQLQAVEVANTNNPAADPTSSLGPLGRRVMDYQGNFRTTDQMTAAGRTLLAKYSAIQQQLTAFTVGNPALQGWDQIQAVLVRSDLGSRPVEYHTVQSLSTPLTNKGTQTVGGRLALAS